MVTLSLTQVKLTIWQTCHLIIAGVLGFLYTGDSPTDAAGNYGISDQTFVLEWVQQNIKNFGGNPNMVKEKKNRCIVSDRECECDKFFTTIIALYAYELVERPSGKENNFSHR